MRKHKIVTITTSGRDYGKAFLILEKSAFETERWATRALLALSRAGADVPDDALHAGALGVLIAGLGGLRKLPFEDAEVLLADMMPCVSFVPDANVKDPANPDRPMTRPLLLPDERGDGDIEELATLLKLREEVLELHLGFSPAAVLSSLVAAADPISSQSGSPTSPRPARKSSRRKEPA